MGIVHCKECGDYVRNLLWADSDDNLPATGYAVGCSCEWMEVDEMGSSIDNGCPDKWSAEDEPSLL